MNTAGLAYQISVWLIPGVLAITLHEAAHGFVAYHFGDDTAWSQGRVTANPLKHIDPVGTILLPGLLLLSHAPFLFGYAKPVPVNFWRLRNPKRDMVWVAAAGPAVNILMALIAAVAFHGLRLLPVDFAHWLAANLNNAVQLNIILAVFNMIPLPPLDGGRVAVGLLPNVLARPLARVERYGMPILIFALLLLPYIGQQMGYDLDIVGYIIEKPVNLLYSFVVTVAGLDG